MAFNPFGSDAPTTPSSSNNPFQSPEQRPAAAPNTFSNNGQPQNVQQNPLQLPMNNQQQYGYPNQNSHGHSMNNWGNSQQHDMGKIQQQMGSLSMMNGHQQPNQNSSMLGMFSNVSQPQQQQMFMSQQAMPNQSHVSTNLSVQPNLPGSQPQMQHQPLNPMQQQQQQRQQMLNNPLMPNQNQQRPLSVTTGVWPQQMAPQHSTPTNFAGSSSMNSQQTAASFDPFSPVFSQSSVQSPQNGTQPMQQQQPAPQQVQGAMGEAWGVGPPSPVSQKPQLSPSTQSIAKKLNSLSSNNVISAQDKELLLKLVEQKDSTMNSRLVAAIQKADSGNTTALSGLVYDMRWSKTNEVGSTTTSATAKSAGAAADDSDAEDSDDMSTISGDSDSGTTRDKEVAEVFKLPHPYAGGFAGVIPSVLRMENDDSCFVGPCLFRVSSKKLFRKWKPVFFVVQQDYLAIYESEGAWKSSRSNAIKVIALHHMQRVGKPTEKKTYSVRDDGRKVFHTVLRANDLEAVETAVASGCRRPTKYDSMQPNFVVCKLGSSSQTQILAIAYAIQSVISAKVKKHQKKSTAGKEESEGSFRVSGRYN